jgi:hypothetical protein
MRRRRLLSPETSSLRALAMLDTILVAAGVGFFAVAILYVLACDRL